MRKLLGYLLLVPLVLTMLPMLLYLGIPGMKNLIEFADDLIGED